MLKNVKNIKHNPYYYDAVKCSSCGSTKDVYAHRYNDDLMCISCINKIMRLAEDEKKEEFIIIGEEQ